MEGVQPIYEVIKRTDLQGAFRDGVREAINQYYESINQFYNDFAQFAVTQLFLFDGPCKLDRALLW